MDKVHVLSLCIFLVYMTGASGTDLCSSYPCLNSGTCTEDNNGYVCECRNGYSGEHCEDGGIIEVEEGSSNERAQFETNQPKLYNQCLRPLNNLKFSVRTERDAHILLQTTTDVFETSDDNYVIYIAGWGGSRTEIYHSGRSERVDIEGLLSDYEFRDFWVSWNKTTIAVGRGNVVGTDGFISFTETPSLMEIKGVSFGTAWYTDASWRFPKGLNECDVNPCSHCEVCVDGINKYTCVEN
ncbi:uncharacterized protein LOC132731282 [Ruditapes philippinarum]|uniref:uncharacterized protein LOC132731282 n=1 Tax=Ruditapes philippinarum TaxID=129788 RepID=UPI00295B603B|nr:uncharacterized protein LOC132731282 [Ruditapes philippinarum]